MIDVLIDRANKMRKNPTKAELEFKKRLIDKKIRFRFQQVIQPYIVDFLIGKFVIEIDGSSHNGKELYDAKRTEYLNKKGYKVIRIYNSEVSTYCLKYFQKLAKIKKDKPFVKPHKKPNPQKERQRLRLEKEATMYEMIQLPNGDFKRVKINQ